MPSKSQAENHLKAVKTPEQVDKGIFKDLARIAGSQEGEGDSDRGGADPEKAQGLRENQKDEEVFFERATNRQFNKRFELDFTENGEPLPVFFQPRRSERDNARIVKQHDSTFIAQSKKFSFFERNKTGSIKQTSVMSHPDYWDLSTMLRQEKLRMGNTHQLTFSSPRMSSLEESTIERQQSKSQLK